MTAPFPRGGMEPKFAALILYDDSTGCDDIDDYFATEADTTIGISCMVDLNKDWYWVFISNSNIYQFVSCEIIIF